MNLQPDETTRKKGNTRVGYDLRQEIWTRFHDHNLSVDTLAKRLRVPKASVQDSRSAFRPPLVHLRALSGGSHGAN